MWCQILVKQDIVVVIKIFAITQPFLGCYLGFHILAFFGGYTHFLAGLLIWILLFTLAITFSCAGAGRAVINNLMMMIIAVTFAMMFM